MKILLALAFIVIATPAGAFGFGPDCSPSEARSLNRELLHLKDHLAIVNPRSEEAIDIKDDIREKQDEIAEWREACQPRLAEDRPLK